MTHELPYELVSDISTYSNDADYASFLQTSHGMHGRLTLAPQHTQACREATLDGRVCSNAPTRSCAYLCSFHRHVYRKHLAALMASVTQPGDNTYKLTVGPPVMRPPLQIDYTLSTYKAVMRCDVNSPETINSLLHCFRDAFGLFQERVTTSANVNGQITLYVDSIEPLHPAAPHRLPVYASRPALNWFMAASDDIEPLHTAILHRFAVFVSRFLETHTTPALTFTASTFTDPAGRSVVLPHPTWETTPQQ